MQPLNLATGRGNTDARSEKTLCADARSATPPERANSSPSAPHVAGAPRLEAFVSRAALVEKLTREWFETESGYSREELAYRRGHNACVNSLRCWLGVAPLAIDEGLERIPVGEEEARQIAIAEASIARLDHDAVRRLDASAQRWVFADDVEQMQIEEAYRALGGES